MFCFKYRRTVANDHTIRFGPHRIDIPPGGPRRSYARGPVELHQRFDGTLAIYYEGTCLTQTQVLNPTAQRIHENLGPDAHRVPPQPRPVLPSSTPKSPQRPSPDHPWKRSFPDRRNRTKLLSS